MNSLIYQKTEIKWMRNIICVCGIVSARVGGGREKKAYNEEKADNIQPKIAHFILLVMLSLMHDCVFGVVIRYNAIRSTWHRLAMHGYGFYYRQKMSKWNMHKWSHSLAHPVRFLFSCLISRRRVCFLFLPISFYRYMYPFSPLPPPPHSYIHFLCSLCCIRQVCRDHIRSRRPLPSSHFVL